ncbi:hypothetical protein KII95_02035 [Leuconostoc gelidum subsp. aenigmaticum]|uniref:Uncharacterized protein n=1 Tax=Leuconostoc gelidum subsp. gelidum TaxID=1607839 RepID=A0AB35FZC2_LEUGE|nr:hypothetical protein [Leuconostoc gelidum subsp. gelidum]MBZ5997388.1 hypothetical protein [Leuconostoc gasicomitatum]MBZ6002816.1 hypothetical protein [Leuconostoc gelidum subsp. aenigmaticum]MBZ5975593.1 hypothetical protein [Leuconostoc gelidum subsp. gelidum]MBZ5976239.1 hypothetical protein [Leuconostoc gelidum subsp. gelidum]
MYKPGKLWVI